MRPSEPLPAPDPEFLHREAAFLPAPGPRDVAFYQRLVVNPFLSYGALALAGLAAVLWSTVGHRKHGFTIVMASMLVAWRLRRFHCLDCGQTARLSRWRDHACGPVRLRWADRRSLSVVRFPSATSQAMFWYVVLWLVILGAAVVHLFMRMERLP